MSDTPPPDASSLDALRREIDAADREIHRLLIHRGEVIEQLIAAKKLSAGGGSAFRPDREASMMRALAERHRGQLPLSAVEHIWREIIGTFTQLQAPFRIVSAKAGDPAMRDLLRYYFGFSAPLAGVDTNRAAVEEVARTGTDLAVVAVDDPLEERWWRGFSLDDGATKGAKVGAYLPFLPLKPGLDLPKVLVIGPADVSSPDDLHLYAVAGEPPAAETGPSGTTLSRDGDLSLVASPLAPAAFVTDFANAAPGVEQPEWLGSFARPLQWP